MPEAFSDPKTRAFLSHAALRRIRPERRKRNPWRSRRQQTSANQREIAGDESCWRSAKAGRREIFLFLHRFFAVLASVLLVRSCNVMQVLRGSFLEVQGKKSL